MRDLLSELVRQRRIDRDATYLKTKLCPVNLLNLQGVQKKSFNMPLPTPPRPLGRQLAVISNQKVGSEYLSILHIDHKSQREEVVVCERPPCTWPPCTSVSRSWRLWCCVWVQEQVWWHPLRCQEDNSAFIRGVYDLSIVIFFLSVTS